MTGGGRGLLRAVAVVLLIAVSPVALSAQGLQMVPLPTPDADALAAAIRRLGPNPRDLDALIVAGELSLKLGDASAAASLFKRAEMLDPMNGRVKAGMARILVQEERPGEALRYFDQAIGYGLDPRSFAGDRGLAYDLIGEQERAQRDYRLALKAGPNDEVVRRYALSLGISGKREAALEQIDTLLRKADRGAWRGRAFILAMTGDVPGANDIATKMMPGAMASGLQPFFVMLPKLSPIDRAFAVHFGEVRSTPQRVADARMAPALPVLGPEPGVALAAAKPVLRAPVVERARDRRARSQDRNRSRERKEPPVRVAFAQAAPVPLPPPPSLPRGPVFAPRAEVVQAVPLQSEPQPKPPVQVGVVVIAAPSPVQPPPSQPVPTRTPPVQIAAAATARGPTARIHGPPAAAPTALKTSTPAAGPSAGLGAGFSSVPTNAGAAASTASAAPVPTPRPAVPVGNVVASAPTQGSSMPVAASTSAVTAPISNPASPPTAPAVPQVAAPIGSAVVVRTPPQTALVMRSAVANAVTPATSDDSILARIMAGISIPASELGVAPVQAVPVAAPVVAAAPAVPKVVAKPVAPVVVAKAKPVPAKPTAAEARAAEKKVLADKKAAADKKLADAKKAADAKALAEEKQLAKTDPPRIWVQVSGGANESDLPKAWGSVKAKASVLNGRQAYSTPLRATNRVVIGPFKTDAEARAFVNQLAKQGVSAFPFTSAKGQKMKQLGGK